MSSLMIVGPDFDQVADTVEAGRIWTVHRCSSVEQFECILQDQRDGAIERLDIVSHGGEGHINMGDGIPLFKSDKFPGTPLVNADLATRIQRKFTIAAQIRLLGCETASTWTGAPLGRFLLLKLGALFNPDPDAGSNRIVFGTLDAIKPEHFGPEGLTRRREIRLLYSSYTAIDFDCPDSDIRSRNIPHVKAGKLPDARVGGLMRKFLKENVRFAREFLMSLWGRS